MQPDWIDFDESSQSTVGAPPVRRRVRRRWTAWIFSIAYHGYSMRESFVPAPGAGIWRWRGFGCALIGLAAAGCAQQPVQQRVLTRQSSEYFPSSVYGPASPRVVADGEAVPRGGGQYLVGRPYTVAGHRYVPSETGHSSQVGMASYYGAAFHGRRTANGEVFDMASISAAHPTMPLPSYARVTNLGNGRSIIVRVNDRGPYHGGRILDVSERTAEALDFRRSGTAHVRVDYVGRAEVEGSDDRKLMATLRIDGSPASLDGAPVGGSPVMVASAAPVAPPPSPRPEAPRVVASPSQRIDRASADGDAEPPVRNVTVVSNAPLPPNRPLDLGTIPGAGVPIAATPARRTAAMFYAPPPPPPRPSLLSTDRTR